MTVARYCVGMIIFLLWVGYCYAVSAVGAAPEYPFRCGSSKVRPQALTAAITWAVLAHPEAVTSPLGAYGALYFSWSWLPALIALIALLVVAWSLLVSTMTDLANMIIPDELSKPLQLAAPFLSLCALGTLGEAAYLNSFFIVRNAAGDSGETIAMFSVLGGVLLVAGIVVLAALLLIASLPFARWVYGTRLKEPISLERGGPSLLCQGPVVVCAVPCPGIAVHAGAGSLKSAGK